METPKKKKTGIRLAQLRNERDMTQKELADTIGVEPSTIANYEIGNRTPVRPIMLKLANYFGVSIDYLMGYTDYPHTSTIELAVKSLPERVKDMLLYDNENAIPFLEFAADCIESGISIETVRDLFKNIFSIMEKLKEIEYKE